jgi:hypothetical protein
LHPNSQLSDELNKRKLKKLKGSLSKADLARLSSTTTQKLNLTDTSEFAIEAFRFHRQTQDLIDSRLLIIDSDVLTQSLKTSPEDGIPLNGTILVYSANHEVKTIDPFLLAVPLPVIDSSLAVESSGTKITFNQVFPIDFPRNIRGTTVYPPAIVKYLKYLSKKIDKVLRKGSSRVPTQSDERKLREVIQQFRDIHLLDFLSTNKVLTSNSLKKILDLIACTNSDVHSISSFVEASSSQNVETSKLPKRIFPKEVKRDLDQFIEAIRSIDDDED